MNSTARRALLTSALWLLVAGALVPVPAANAQLGAAQHADTAIRIETLLAQAEAGDARASFLLGTRYASGRAGYRDDSEAVKWFGRAAEAGLAEAQYNLGIMLASGRGVERDLVRAAHWYEAAARQDVVEAQYNLGTLYLTGRGVPRDSARGFHWLSAAASHGLAEAQYNLAALYEHGRGVQADLSSAVEWYRRAAAGGYAPARQRLSALGMKPLASAPERSPELDIVPTEEQAHAAPATLAEGGSPGIEAAANPWLSGQDSALYTVQLVSHTDERRTQAFIRERGIKERALYYRTRRDGVLHYSVIYGFYSSYEQAREQARRLPPSLAGLEPWVRNLGKLKEALAD